MHFGAVYLYYFEPEHAWVVSGAIGRRPFYMLARSDARTPEAVDEEWDRAAGEWRDDLDRWTVPSNNYNQEVLVKRNVRALCPPPTPARSI